MSSRPVAGPEPSMQMSFCDALFVDLDRPGAVVERVELADGVAVHLNGAGTPVGVVFPRGLDGVQLPEED